MEKGNNEKKDGNHEQSQYDDVREYIDTSLTIDSSKNKQSLNSHRKDESNVLNNDGYNNQDSSISTNQIDKGKIMQNDKGRGSERKANKRKKIRFNRKKLEKKIKKINITKEKDSSKKDKDSSTKSKKNILQKHLMKGKKTDEKKNESSSKTKKDESKPKEANKSTQIKKSKTKKQNKLIKRPILHTKDKTKSHSTLRSLFHKSTDKSNATKKPKKSLLKLGEITAQSKSNQSKKQMVKTDSITPSQESFDIIKNLVEQHKIKVIEQEGFSEFEEYEEVDFYPLTEPFSYVSIMQNDATRERRYLLLEVPLSDEEKSNHDFIIDAMQTFSVNAEVIDALGIEQVFEQKVQQIINDYNLHVDRTSHLKLLYWLKNELLGLGKLEPLMKDVELEDISCDGSMTPLFLYHRRHGSIQSNVRFEDEEELSAFVMRLAQKCGKHISIASPMIDATMPDGSRIQMTLSTEVSTKGSTFTIRKFKEQPFSPADLVEFNTLSAEMMAYLWLAVQHGSNALIAGGTASGKTSTLNAISLFIPRESKIVSIEETREINLPHPNWIPGVTRTGFGDYIDGKLTGEIDLYELMKAALRQRPEYILVGEIRGREAYVLFQAMATGHTTYSTVHADSTKSLIHRLEGEPINIPRIMLQSLDIVCIQTIARVKNKRARRCKQIIEIIDIDPTTKEILTNEVFHWDPVKDTFVYSGKSYLLDKIRNEKNWSHEQIVSELQQRKKLLSWMVIKSVHGFDEVATLTANYYENPDEVLKKIED